MLQLSLVQPHVFRLVVSLPSDQVLVLSSNLSMLQDGFYLEFNFAIGVYGRDVCSQPIVPVWPQQAHVEHVMNVAKGLAVSSSRQVQLVRGLADPLQHFEGSNKAVLQFSWSL